MQAKMIQKGIALAILSVVAIGVLPFVANATLAIEQDKGTGSFIAAETNEVPSNVDGDYNRDGIVDAADFVLWRDTLGKSGNALSADGNRDKTIGEADRALWHSQFGQESEQDEESGAQAIPEPAAAALAFMFLVAAGMWRWFDLRAARNRQ
jgi:hypothetical protein